MPSPKNLLIVESPAKARTIAGFLGSDFDVKSSIGHLRDLPSKKLGVDVKRNFEPTYEVDPAKKAIIAELKKSAKGAEVWLATDEDREGEAIAWHLCQILGLDAASAKRIVYHEMTKPAIEAAIKNPRQIDQHLVDAQQARRILDRLVGYELSPVLWKKIKTGLSAGRVQSVAVRLLVEREKQIREFNPATFYKVGGQFSSEQENFRAELNRQLDDEAQAKQFLESLISARFNVTDVRQKPSTRNPSAPFTTSTLQQEAARKLSFSVRQTMRLAQNLYESGHITYMRTDSTNLSEIAIQNATTYIKTTWGEKYSRPQKYQTKSASAQEAHEAIRPSHLDRLNAGEDSRQQKLYQLIWQRALASQMSPAQIELSEIHIGISDHDETFVAKGQVLLFDGFMKIYRSAGEDIILPKLRVGNELTLDSITAEQNFTRAPARFSEAMLVRKLEELGIGRPSTYAPTIGTIEDRGYVEKKDIEGQSIEAKQFILARGKLETQTKPVTIGADRRKLVPTELAEIVTNFLVKYFEQVMDYSFTASAETELDQIAEGKLQWQKMLDKFYHEFHPLVESSESASRQEASGSRILGKDPKTGEVIMARYGRYGLVLQMGEADKDKDIKPRFAPMPAGLRLEEVTLEQALPMFDLPRKLGKVENGDAVTASIGRFGPYLQIGKKYISLKDKDPLTISLDESLKVISEHQKEQDSKIINDFGKVKVLNGRFGPYVTDGKVNARVPKISEPSKITEAEAKSLLEASAKRKFTPRRRQNS